MNTYPLDSVRYASRALRYWWAALPIACSLRWTELAKCPERAGTTAFDLHIHSWLDGIDTRE